MARPLTLVKISIFLALLSSMVQADQNLKLDESPPVLDNKCDNCPCDTPCNPPPSPPPPSPPPPPKNPPPSNYCPPPPPPPSPPSPPSPSGQKPPNPPYVYINGPPGSVYPVYPYYSGQGRSFSMGIIPFLISILWVLAF